MTTSAYTCNPAYGPVTKDITTEALTTIDTTDCTLTATTVVFPLATNTKKATLRASQVSYTTLRSNISFWSGFFGVSTQPGSGQVAVISNTVQGTTERYIRIGDSGASDTKLRIYDKNGNLVGTSSASISTSTQTEVCVCFDCLTLPTVYVHIWIAGVYDTGFNTGLTPANFFGTNTPAWGEWLAAATNRGADMTAHDFTMRYTSNTALAPHLTAFPRLKVYGGASLAATIEGTYVEWNVTGDASPNTWKNIAATHDFPNDGDATVILATNVNLRHLFRWGDGTGGFVNPVSGLTVDAVYSTWAARTGGAGKTANDGMFRLSSTDLTVTANTTPVTTYVGVFAPTNYDANRPGGGAWVSTDFDLRAADNYSELEFGVKTVAAATVGINVTELPGPTIVAYSATLPLAKTPEPLLAGIWVPTNQPQFPKVSVRAY